VGAHKKLRDALFMYHFGNPRLEAARLDHGPELRWFENANYFIITRECSKIRKKYVLGGKMEMDS